MSNLPALQRTGAARRQEGATLIELMIALLLGLVVVAAASGLFLTNKRVYASTETLNRIQENSRVSFEIMSRDIREAGGNPCGRSSQLVSQLSEGPTGWWSDHFDLGGMQGYEQGTAAPGTTRKAGTDAIDLNVVGGGDIFVTDHSNPGADLDVTSVGDIKIGDILMVCNSQYSLVFKATNVNDSSLKIIHNSDNPGNPGNCTQRFRIEYDCENGNRPSDYCMYVPPAGSTSACTNHSRSPARIVKLQSLRWYVADNGRGGDSLYRAKLEGGGPGVAPTIVETAEIAEGISDLQLQYRSAGSTTWQNASAVGDWAAVNAMRVTFVAEGTEGAVGGRYLDGTDGNVLNRTTSHVVAIRNRESVL